MKILLCMLFPILAFSQEVPDADPAARSLLQQIEAGLDEQGFIHYAFDLGIYPPESDSIVQEGEYWQQGTSYHLALEDINFISNGVSLWVVDKASEEIQIHDYEDPDPSEVAHPQNLLKIYQNPNFRYRLAGDQMIEFLPVEKDFEYFRAVMHLSGSALEISKIRVWSKDGYQYEVRMSKSEYKQTPSNDEFTLNEANYPGYHIEDLRIN